MECPFCLGEIRSEAVACRSCGRDLTGQIYLLRGMAELLARVGTLEAKLAEPAKTVVVKDPISAALTANPEAQIGSGRAFVTLIVSNVLLLAVHHLFVLTWNLAPVWLFAATLLVPVPFGFWAIWRGSYGVVFWLAAFAVNAVLVIAEMNVDTAWVTPAASILPTSQSEWVQNLQFAIGLYCSFATGVFASLLYLRLRHPEHPQLDRSRQSLLMLTRYLWGAMSATSIDRTARYIASAGTIATAAGALILGVKRL